jgi:hypothetical protein
MEKYARVLVIIFFLCLINIGLNVYTLSKVNNQANQKTIETIASAPTSSPIPGTKATTDANLNENEVRADLTIIKAEIRSLREILGTTKSFEELSKLITSLEGI